MKTRFLVPAGTFKVLELGFANTSNCPVEAASGTAVYKYGGGDSAHLFGAVRQYPGTSFPPR